MKTRKEIWSWIDGYEGYYMISTLGKVWSAERYRRNGSKWQVVNAHLVATADNGNGYKIVPLWKEGKQKMSYVHRLVAEAFLPHLKHLKYINHKDENKANNNVENLEWCTAKYNCNYGSHGLKFKETLIRNKYNRAIDVYTLEGVFIETFQLSNELCKKYKIDRRNLYSVCNNLNKSTNGYRFAFHGEALGQFDKTHKKKRVIKYNEKGIKVAEYKNIRDAENKNGMYRGFLRTKSITGKTNKVLHNGATYEIIK